MTETNQWREAADGADKAIADLQEVVAGVEGDGVPARFMAGHGLQSRRFRFWWSDGSLTLDFDLPCGRVLAAEEDQRADDAEIATACRMGQLLLSARSSGALLRAEEGEASLFASCGDDGTRYVLRDPDGNILDAGGWSVLVARLEAMCHHGAVRPADVSVLFP